MKKQNGQWIANRKERISAIKTLMNKGYDNNTAINILDRCLLEYNPQGLSLTAMIDKIQEVDT